MSGAKSSEPKSSPSIQHNEVRKRSRSKSNVELILEVPNIVGWARSQQGRRVADPKLNQVTEDPGTLVVAVGFKRDSRLSQSAVHEDE